jgi:[acyl-carrier-protein] S-malonyltransferase
MGQQLYDTSAAAQSIFDQADAALGFSLTNVCFDGPEALLTSTEYAQPAILTTSVALLAYLAGQPAEIADFVQRHACFVAGHSLGEYTALVAAGALDLPTAVRLVRRRGELMADAHEGTMAAVMGMDEATLEGVCRSVSENGTFAVVANYNSPGQLVISGAVSAVAEAAALAQKQGARRVMPLKVSAAFHSPLMRNAALDLDPMIRNAHIQPARVPVVANVSAEALTEAAAIRKELVLQVTAPVRWIASVEYMAALGIDTFVEIGPGNVLSGLIRRIVPQAQVLNVSDLAGADALRSTLGN